MVAVTDMPLNVMVIVDPQYWEEPGTSPNCYGWADSQSKSCKTQTKKKGGAYIPVQRDDLGIREREDEGLVMHGLRWSLT
jgi:hypothetical protein